MNLFRALLTVSGFTLLSRVTGLARETLIARAFGASQFTDAFYVAFRIPNLLRRISAEGAFSQAFVPILAEFKNQQGHDATKALVDATSTVLAWALAVLSVIGVVGASGVVFIVASGLAHEGQAYALAVTMTRIMFPYIIFISLTSLASGVLNTYKNFSLPAFAPVLLNVAFIVAAVFVAPRLQTPVYALAWAVIVGGVLQFIVQLPGLKKIDMMPRIGLNPLKALAHRGVKRVLSKMVPAMFAVSVAQISLIINTNIASRIGPGAVSWINYADRLMEFPTALLGVALGTILLPSLSKAHVDADPHEYSSLLDWGLRVTFLLAAPSAVALFFFAEPLTADAVPLRQVRRQLGRDGGPRAVGVRRRPDRPDPDQDPRARLLREAGHQDAGEDRRRRADRHAVEQLCVRADFRARGSDAERRARRLRQCAAAVSRPAQARHLYAVERLAEIFRAVARRLSGAGGRDALAGDQFRLDRHA